MIVYDLNSGHREYPGYDEIEDRRGGGRGRSRRSDGTYMGYGGGIYDHYGMHEKMKEMEERENELEERERRLEERERRHEMEDREYRRMGYESYPTDYYGDDNSDGFPKVFKCENELVKATLMYLDDPDAPEGVAFIRWLAVQDYLGEKINWKDLT